MVSVCVDFWSLACSQTQLLAVMAELAMHLDDRRPSDASWGFSSVVGIAGLREVVRM